MKMLSSIFTIIVSFALLLCSRAFISIPILRNIDRLSLSEKKDIVNNRHSFQLFMGRAAAVRAATKARTDAAKAKNYARFAKKILIAVKSGGGPDPAANRQLSSVIADAKAANVPKDIINRNIEKGSKGVSEDYKELIYEYYGHGGASLLVHALTDNEKRALNDISIIAKKNELRAASVNAVAFRFAKRARLDVTSVISEDDLIDWCLELGIDDFVLYDTVDDCPLTPKEENTCVIYVEQKDMASLRDFLRGKGYELEVNLASIPIDGFRPISEEDIEKNLAAIAALELLDDVDFVEHDMDLIINPED